MKKMRLLVVLLIATFAVVYCQPDKTFKVKITFEQGLQLTGGVITFPDGTTQGTAGGGTGSVTWDNVLNKPVFATVATSGSYNDLINRPSLDFKPASYVPDWEEITNKPETEELSVALASLGIYLGRTTAEIDAITPPDGFGIAFDKTLGVYKVYKNGIWTVVITSN